MNEEQASAITSYKDAPVRTVTAGDVTSVAR